MIASAKPRSSITIASRVYMTPIRLWSTLVIHSRHRYGSQPFSVIQPNMAMIARMTTAPVTSGIGWSSGMAAQVSLPSMLGLRSRGYVGVWPAGLRARPRRQHLCGDLLEQVGSGRTVGERSHIQALPGQVGIARGIEGWAAGARGLDPGSELVGRHCVYVEKHARETVAAEVARQAVERARGVRLQVQLRRHAVHRVDHAAELRDEKGVHHVCRGEGEVN